MKRFWLLPGSLFLGVALYAGCSSNAGGFSSSFDAGEAGPIDTSDGGPGLFDDASTTAAVNVTLTGVVYAPNGTLPLAGTLVYITDAQPDPIPQQTYCDKCITIPAGTFVVSKADGTFSLPVKATTGKHFLVVQKGQFRRVRPFNVEKEGELRFDKTFTSLPGKRDATLGDDVPKMVVLKGPSKFDKIEESLTKLGITEIEVQNSRDLVKNAAELQKYHVVFIPCDDRDNPQSATAETRQNLQAFVKSGGKLYVTDWSYEWVRQPFGGFLGFDGDQSFGQTTVSEYDGAGTVVDPGLKDWLTAVGETSFTLQGSYTRINYANTLPGLDPDGKDTLITPKVWMNVDYNSKPYASTVSFEQQCGRVLFSTYHTEGGFGGSGQFLAQEKALLYILLEVTACAGEIGGPK